MKLPPASMYASSTASDAFCSVVQPNVLPPRHSAATFMPVPRSLRISMRALLVRSRTVRGRTRSRCGGLGPRRHLSWVHTIEQRRALVARSWPGVLLQHALVDIRAPARRVGEPDVAVADHRRLGDERFLPRDVVDVDLHDAHVG